MTGAFSVIMKEGPVLINYELEAFYRIYLEKQFTLELKTFG